ncbi:hypothetical protein LCGC14_1107290, partial [marine sediment metagenome]
RNKEKRQEYCRKYHKEHKQERAAYKAKHRDRYRNQILKRRYGINIERHKQIYVEQQGCCAICRKPIEYNKVHTDHNHITGIVRGILCPNCNHLLGQAKDSIDILETAIKYLNGD